MQTAVPVRVVGDLCEMGTMWTVEEGVRCVSFCSETDADGIDEVCEVVVFVGGGEGDLGEVE